METDAAPDVKAPTQPSRVRLPSGQRGRPAADGAAGIALPALLELPGTVHAPGDAREFVRRTCAGHERLDDLVLIVSELVTNAARHSDSAGGGAVSVLVARAGRAVLIEVGDAGSGTSVPCVHPADSLAESGRGLRLIEELSGGRWGHYGDEHGRTVWVKILSS